MKSGTLEFKRLVFAIVMIGSAMLSANAEQPGNIDFNGDKQIDLARVWNNGGAITVDMLQSAGSSFKAASALAAPAGSFVNNHRLFTGDFNGDGKTEIARMFDDGGSVTIDVFTAAGSALTSERWASKSGKFSYTDIWFAADFNGDGKTEVAKVYATGTSIAIDVYVKSAQGSSFTADSWGTGGTYSAKQRFFLGDFNNDKKTDIAKVSNNAGALAVSVYESNGTSFIQKTYVTGDGDFSEYPLVLSGDFDGNGQTDLVKIWQDNASRKMSSDVYVSGNGSMQRQSWAALQGDYSEEQLWLTGDFSGDGKDDLAKIWKVNGKTAISVHASASGKFSESSWSNGQDIYKEMQQWLTGDFNGDGKKDLAKLWSDNGAMSINVFKSTGTSFAVESWATQSVAMKSGQKLLIPHINENNRIEGCVPPPASATPATTFDALQKVMNAGIDCILCQKTLYEVDSSLIYMAPFQGIYTEDAELMSQYATLRSTNLAVTTLLKGSTQNNVRLEKVIADGNRYGIGALDKDTVEKALFQFGGNNGHKIRNTVLMGARSWSTLQIHEGTDASADNCIVDNNIVIGCGPDGRGNGLATKENQTTKGHWVDCITLKAKRTLVRNNFLLDPTDVGVACFSATGSIIERNVNAAMSRESGGAIDMVDGIPPYLDGTFNTGASYGTCNTYNYKGTTIRNNYFDSYGGRIDIGLGLGSLIWRKPPLLIMKGGIVVNNVMSGEAFGYGIAVNGVLDYTVTGNISNAIHEGKGDGESVPPDEPKPFMYDPKGVYGNTVLQPEFVKNVAPMIHLLKNNRAPFIDGGNLVAGLYFPHEVEAIVKAAYVEMLHRLPASTELTTQKAFLQQVSYYNGTMPRNLNTADMLRQKLAQSAEFQAAFGAIGTSKDALQLHRISIWQKAMVQNIDSYVTATGDYPDIKSIYQKILSSWGDTRIVVGVKTAHNRAGNSTFHFSGPAFTTTCPAGKVGRITIHNLSGRIVNELPVNANRLVWDGTNRYGNRLAHGIYSVRLHDGLTNPGFAVVITK